MGSCDREDAGSMLLPLFEETEVSLPWWFRAILYGLGLAWLFVAVAIISDIFMATIEHITAKQSVVTDKTGAKILVRTWNATVANLTLMALGSSAPEILLALVETVGNNFYAGDLGPSTIVGSAAFNLLVIIAVCVTAIPEDIEGGRKIDDLNVYCVTAISSLFAYAWMVIVLKFNSPDVVELPEAAATFSFFWIMVLVAYIVDRGFICSKRATEGHVVSVGELKEAGDFLKDNEISLDKIIEELDKGTLSELTEKEKEMVLMMKVKVSNDATKPKSRREKARAIKRQQERQNMVRDPIVDALGIELTEKIKTLTTLSSCGEANEEEYDFARQIVRFVSPEYSCLECDGVVDVSVIRFPAKGPLRVEYKTVEDTATGDVDYKHIEGILDFIDGEASKKISVEIIDDDEVEEDESFFVVLSNARPNAKIEGGECRVTIIDDDLPGEFGFEKKDTAIKCSEAAGVVRVPITRRNGASGCVSIEWVTEDVTALAGSHYVKSSGIVEFEPGEIVREIEVHLIDKKRNCVDNSFKIDLVDVKDVSGKAKPTAYTTSIVTIVHDDGSAGLMDKAMRAMNIDKRQLTSGTKNYAKQIRNAFVIGGVNDEDETIDELEDEGVGLSEAIVWAISFPWMLIFAVFVPPVEYCGGAIAFFLSLLCIGGITVFVGDLAYLFGCVLNLPLDFTAITFVALGTSLPDTFASRGAALHDSNADASIGNVTGSNSVNVFLGLGLPWLVGAIYWDRKGADKKWYGLYGKKASDGTKIKGSDPDVPTLGYSYPNGALVYPSGSLVFSVGVFICCALTCIFVLAVRRRVYGCELGGPRIPAILTSVLFVLLWLIYIGMSALEQWGYVNPPF